MRWSRAGHLRRSRLPPITPWLRSLRSLQSLLLILMSGAGLAAASPTPLQLSTDDGRSVDTCADPSVLRGRGASKDEPRWTLLCTTDPLRGDDLQTDGSLRFRRLPVFTSDDLRRWRYRGEALPDLPPQAAPNAGLWAPEIVRVGAKVHLYYAITDTADALSPEPGCTSDSAIGVAVADSPAGPWTVQPGLVVAPRRAGAGCSFDWTIDPDLLVTPAGEHVLYYGSYGGGIVAQRLSADALSAVGEPVPITPPDRFEGAEVVVRGGWYWLFVSAADCCRGPLTGYAVFVGRSKSPFGPFVDRGGHPLGAARSGGSPVIVQDGGRWVGPGHNSVFRDDHGRWRTVFHAIDRHDGWLGTSTLSKRPSLIGTLRWRDGWPQLAGAAVPAVPRAGGRLWADHFGGTAVHPRWRDVPPAAALNGGVLQLPTQAGDLHGDANNAVLASTALPGGDLLVQARVRLAAPADGVLGTPVQAGLAVMRDDDAYAKLVHVALGTTRQTEFAVEHPSPPGGRGPRYGSTFVGPPADWTWLRLLVRRRGGEAVISACTRAGDRAPWVCGGRWVHPAMDGPLRLALVSMGGVGYAAEFDRVVVDRPAP